MPALTYASPLSILVVDDDASMLAVYSAILPRDGHAIGKATGGADALRQFQERHWDIVVTDRAMPGLDGEMVARKIKELSPSTPVVMVTGFAPPACCAGVEATVRKPFTRAELAQAVTHALAVRFVAEVT